MLAKDDYKAHYELGLQCDACGQEDNALAQFLYCEDKPDVPDNVYLKIAQIYLNRNDRDKAVTYYKKYLSKHPEEELIVKKLEELTGKDQEISSSPVPSSMSRCS